MKLVGTVYNYIVKNSEMTGIWSEKILCDVLKIKFNSKRKYITSENYPLFLRKNIENIKWYLQKLNITEHSGHLNNYYDFKCSNGNTVSLKTNISGSRISPQNIGQTSLNNFSLKTGYFVETLFDYKKLVLNNKQDIVNLYLSHIFCCQHLISFKFENGKMFHFKKINNENVKLVLQESKMLIIKFNKDLLDWTTGSNGLKILINNEYYTLCEFTIHNNKSSLLQCRFNIDTIILLINNKMIENLELKTIDLENKLKIKIETTQLKRKYEELNERRDESLIIKSKKRKLI